SSGGNTIPAGKEGPSTFRISGVVYTIDDVLQDFAYFSAYRTNAHIGKNKGKSDEVPPDKDASRVFIGPPSSRKEIPQWKEERDKVELVDYRRDGVRETLRASDDQKLRQLSSAIGLHSIVLSLEALADAIEAAMGFIMDAMELIPGVGQAVAAARIATAVFAFMGGGAFDQLLALVRDDPKKIVKDALDKLTSTLFTPSKMWSFLLFARFPLVGFEGKQTTNNVRSQHGKGKLGRIIRKVAKLGLKLAGMFVRFQRGVVGIVDRARLFVLGRPLVARVVGWMAGFIDFLRGVDLSEIFPGGLAKSPKKTLQEGVGKLGTRIRGVFDTVSGFKLPKKIIPLEDVFGIVIDILVRRIGGKYKYAVRGFMAILEVTGQKRKILTALANEIDKSDKSPNTFIAKTLASALGKEVQSASRGLFSFLGTSIAPHVDRLVGSKDFSKALGDPPNVSVDVTPNLDDIEDSDQGVQLEKSDSSHEPEPIPLPTMPPSTGGRPLDPRLRSDIEGKLGEDLRHVRIHADSTADQLTRAIGAHAATSGSHVFMRRGLQPDTPRGADVLRHEVGHVLQQSGSHPLAGGAAPMPRLGRPGVGVLVDPSREADADRWAAAAAGSGSAGSLGMPRPDGLQPALMDDVARPLLTTLSDPSGLRRRALADESTGDDREGRVSLDRQARKDVDLIWTNLHAGLVGTSAKFAAPFGTTEGQEAIRARLNDKTVKKRLAGAVGDIALQARVPLKPANKDDMPIEVVHPGRFAAGLVGHIFGSTGLKVSIDFKTKDARVEGAKHPKQPAIVPATPYDSLKFTFVYLPHSGSGTKLWRSAMKGTYPGKTDAQLAAKRARLRGLLVERGVSSDVWDGNKYALSSRLVSEEQALERELAKLSGGMDRVEPANLPPKKTKGSTVGYLDRDASVSPPAKNIGLRLGIFGQYKTPATPTELVLPGGDKVPIKGQQRGLERESHHTTQYLLLEFFHNVATNALAFPILDLPTTRGSGLAGNKFATKDVYPGLVAASGKVTSFQHTTPMPIADYEAGRGGRMPALLIARVTHRTGGLHITSTAADFGPKVKTPAGAVQAKFHELLGGDSGAYRRAEKQALKKPDPSATGSMVVGPRAFQDYVTKTGEAKVKQTVDDAMVKTYRWMYHERMEPALRTALTEIEKPYYNDLAEAASLSDRITDDEMKAVANAAKANNIKHMRKAGFERG
ncbi:MAG: DUF4157 domain-containing protein, partial [Nannocystaceae bacterium]